MELINCTKCYHCKPQLIADYYNKFEKRWVLAHIVYYCKRLHKGIRLVNRECKKYTPKTQSLLTQKMTIKRS